MSGPGLETSPQHRRALHDAVGRYHRPLVAYARTLLGSLEQAQDVAQDTLLKLCEQPESTFSTKIAPRLAPWLFTVCRNRSFDILRKERRMTTLDTSSNHQQAASGSPADLAEQHDDTDALLGLVAALPTKQREIVQLRFQAGLSYKQISEVTGQTTSHVGVILHDAMGSLRKQMNQLTA